MQIAIDLSSPAIDINPAGNQISRYAATSVGVRKWDLGDGFRSSIFSRSVYNLRGLALGRVIIACLWALSRWHGNSLISLVMYIASRRRISSLYCCRLMSFLLWYASHIAFRVTMIRLVLTMRRRLNSGLWASNRNSGRSAIDCSRAGNCAESRIELMHAHNWGVIPQSKNSCWYDDTVWWQW